MPDAVGRVGRRSTLLTATAVAVVDLHERLRDVKRDRPAETAAGDDPVRGAGRRVPLDHRQRRRACAEALELLQTIGDRKPWRIVLRAGEDVTIRPHSRVPVQTPRGHVDSPGRVDRAGGAAAGAEGSLVDGIRARSVADERLLTGQPAKVAGLHPYERDERGAVRLPADGTVTVMMHARLGVGVAALPSDIPAQAATGSRHGSSPGVAMAASREAP